jgi:hypothetical protein
VVVGHRQGVLRGEEVGIERQRVQGLRGDLVPSPRVDVDPGQVEIRPGIERTEAARFERMVDGGVVLSRSGGEVRIGQVHVDVFGGELQGACVVLARSLPVPVCQPASLRPSGPRLTERWTGPRTEPRIQTGGEADRSIGRRTGRLEGVDRSRSCGDPQVSLGDPQPARRVVRIQSERPLEEGQGPLTVVGTWRVEDEAPLEVGV